jgi:hypothetical protein
MCNPLETKAAAVNRAQLLVPLSAPVGGVSLDRESVDA